MNPLAQKENIRTLAATIGIDEDRAAELLDVTAVVTYDPEDTVAFDCAKHVANLLGQTLSHVYSNKNLTSDRVAVEIVMGDVLPRFNAPHVFVHAADEAVSVSSEPTTKPFGKIHRVGGLLGACYATAAALAAALGDSLRFRVPDLIELKLTDLLGPDLPLLYEPVAFDETYLAGAGAVGNGFIYGLSRFDVSGELHIADDDKVGEKNLQRCVFFDEHHVNLPKASTLSTAASRLLPNLNAVPFGGRIQDLPVRRAGPWLKRLIVGVDSPRARRSLQSEFPGEVFDASTTGISEVVLHFHRQPTACACLGCVYPHSQQENAHENHVAEVLGVSLSDVLQERISSGAAEKICARYMRLIPSQLVGSAYDTLFKQLCSTAELKNSEDRQVLAPFAFVSVFAGTLLAVEFVRRIQRGHDGLFNEWRLSPWFNPVYRRRRTLPKNPACEFCSDATMAEIAGKMWGR